MLRMPSLLSMILTAALLTGCTDTGAGRWTGSVRDSAGVAIVENPEAGVWAPGRGWTVEEELRIGTVDGDANYQFGQLAGIGIGSDGSIFVLDQQARQVRVFSSDGRFQRTIGRPGQGPGELGAGVAALLVGRGDTLFVPDMQAQRVNLYLSDGTAVSSFRMSLATGIPLSWAVTRDALVAQLRPLVLPNQPGDSMDVIVKIHSDGRIGDTLRTIPSGRTFSFASGTPEFNFFSAEPAWAVDENSRLLFAINSTYRLSVYDSNGTLERIIVRATEPRRVESADQRTLHEAMERLWRTAGVPPQAIQQLSSNVHFAEYFPAFLQMMNGPEGSIWVQRVQQPSALSGSEREAYNPMLDLGAPEWDVFDAEGRYLGMVLMPPRFQPVRFVDDRVYGIFRDDLDVQHVMRLRIRREG